MTILRILVEVLRDSGVARPMVTAGTEMGASPIAEIERTFTRHLDEERGLHARHNQGRGTLSELSA